MKKITSMIIVMTLSIISFCLPVMANEFNNNYENMWTNTQIESILKKYANSEIVNDQRALNEIGALAFPEYAEEILYPSASFDEKIVEDRIVFSEVRHISELESVTYQKSEKGIASIVYQKSVLSNVPVSVNGGTQYTTQIMIGCTICTSYMIVSDLTYTIYNNSYDNISNYGSCLADGSYVSPSGYQAVENNASHAYVLYVAYLPSWSASISSVLINASFDVGSNLFTVYVNGSAI